MTKDDACEKARKTFRHSPNAEQCTVKLGSLYYTFRRGNNDEAIFVSEYPSAWDYADRREDFQDGNQRDYYGDRH